MQINPILTLDGYKTGHKAQYPDGTELVYSNFTPRSNKLSNLPDNNEQMIFFGLQSIILDFFIKSFQEDFFSRDRDEVVAEYKQEMDEYLGVDAVDVQHIHDLHSLGYLPIEIRALPEGTAVEMKVPCMTIHNTLPSFFWLVNYFETVISCDLWKSCVTATTANWYKELFDQYAEKTSDCPEFTGFQGHDFSMRGAAGKEDAARSGAAHLTSFYGTDTIPAIKFAKEFYAAEGLVGCSVPATEHSVACLSSSYHSSFYSGVEEVYNVDTEEWDVLRYLDEKEMQQVSD